MSPPLGILFVCTGNICRSPTAHGVVRSLVGARGLAEQVEVDSAGFEDWHVGELADPRSRALARARGVDIDDLRARALVDADFEAFDPVVGLDQEHVDRALRRCDPALAGRMGSLGSYCGLPRGQGVPVPYDGPEEDFAHVFEVIELGCHRLLAELMQSGATAREPPGTRRSAESGHSVKDPRRMLRS